MKKSQAMFDLESLAASQWGMFTTAQAQNLGVRRNQIARMVESGRVESSSYGVYRFCAGDEPEMAEVKAAWLSAFPKQTVAERMAKRPYDAIVAGRTAAYALGTGDFLASPYTFAVAQRKQTSRQDVVFLKSDVAEGDVVFVGALPTTSYERTVYDLIRLHEDPDLVDKFMRDATRVKGHQFDVERLSELLAPLAARNSFGKMRGDEFAADLLRRNSVAAQIEQANNSSKSVLNAMFTPEQRVLLQEQAEGIGRYLAESGVLEKYNETMKAVQAAIDASGAASRIQDIVKTINIPQVSTPLAIEAAMRAMPSIQAMQNRDWANLVLAVSQKDDLNNNDANEIGESHDG